ncbi:MAG: type I-E CRISPR-associated protein Cas5/CasD [Proteobacteria bacterium]|nr:type I-E CRISPR-associated protein Cas5/CasD [Pseudomonadota bacterium]
MNSVLLMACGGPMQSWGTRSRFEIRDTEREPSKSGIIGLVASALGRNRKDSIADLASLHMGVRADREGIMKKDFQTVQQVAVASGGTPSNLVSTRHYLSDAVFLVGLEGDHALLSDIHHAMKHPKRPLFLGRKSFVPSIPFFLSDGLMTGINLDRAFQEYPPLVQSFNKKENAKDSTFEPMRVVIETDEKTHAVRKDQPISFDLKDRRFRDRYVRIHQVIPRLQGGGE